MKQISDLVATFLELDFLPYFLAFLSLFIVFRFLVLFLDELFDFSSIDFICDSFHELKQFLSKVYVRFKAWFFKYQTDDQDIAE